MDAGHPARRQFRGNARLRPCQAERSVGVGRRSAGAKRAISRWRDETGQAVVLSAVWMVVLLGMAGLVIDGGSWGRGPRQPPAGPRAPAPGGGPGGADRTPKPGGPGPAGGEKNRAT